MIRILAICFVLLLMTACIDKRYQIITTEWLHPDLNERKAAINFDEINKKKVSQLHRKEVLIRGRLVYEYDETAVYPFFEETGFRPVWINLKSHELALHRFLLANHGTSVAIQGVLDTTQIIDKNSYSSALVEINYVSAIGYRNKFKSDED